MDWDLVVWRRQEESERKKEADTPWFMQKTNKVSHEGTGHPLQQGEGTGHLLERVLEGPARE